MKELQTMINNEYKYLLRNTTKWEKIFFKDFFGSIMSFRTTIMKKLTLKKYKKVDKQTEKIKYFFEKDNFKDFSSKVEKRCFNMLGEITEKDYICIDEVDIAKPYAKKMEDLAKVRDGSTGNIVSGYMFHGVSIRGIPVILEYEDLTNNFKSQYFGSIIERILKYSKGKGTLVLDAGYDIASYIDFLNQKGVKYIIRAKKDRLFFDLENKKVLKLKDFKDGIHKVRIGKYQKEVYLHIKTNPKFIEPMRILSNSKEINISEYSKRWEIESIFKTMKQEFELEKIQTSSLIVLKNIVASIQLAMALSRIVYNQTNSFKDVSKVILSNRFISRFKRHSQSLGLTMNSNSIVKFISYCLQKLYKIPKNKPQKILNKNNGVSAQLSIFSCIDLGKTGEI